jgi:AraC-like DNA-binding protein
LSFLTHIFDHISVRARLLHAAGAHVAADPPADGGDARLYLIQCGPVHIAGVGRTVTTVIGPGVLLVPRPSSRPLSVTVAPQARVGCVSLRLGRTADVALGDALPAAIGVEAVELPATAELLQAFFDEVAGAGAGQQAVLDRLVELLLMQVLRHCLDRGLIRGGTLAGLADRRLAPVLAALHRQPARPWTLVEMAAMANMSRSRFALRFHRVVGTTPAAYLAEQRICTAQGLLKARRPMKCVADEVGYGSTSAFIRAFTRRVGCPPTAWLRGRRDCAGSTTAG